MVQRRLAERSLVGRVGILGSVLGFGHQSLETMEVAIQTRRAMSAV